MNTKTTTDPRKKVLIFSMGYDPFIGGAEIAIAELTKRLTAKYEFHIVTLRIRRELPRFEDKGYIKIHRVGISAPGADNTGLAAWPLKINKWLFPFLAYMKGMGLHRRERFDAHWCMLAFTGAIGSLLFKWAFPRVPYLLELQDGRTYEEREKLFGPLVFPLIRKSFQQTDAIKTISTFQIDVAERMGALSPKTRIPNGVDTTAFAASIPESNLDEVRQKLGIKSPSDNIYLVSTTRLVERRGHEALITSLTHLPEKYVLILCGSGPHEATLRTLAEDKQVTERIIWAGDVAYADIPKYLAVADVFVRPSVYEGMGNSFIEAMAAGIPVVGTPVGGIVDFLFDTEKNPHPDGLQTGFVAAVNDPEDIAQQIIATQTNPEKTAMIVKNAQELAQKEYDWDYIATRMDEEILSSLVLK